MRWYRATSMVCVFVHISSFQPCSLSVSIKNCLGRTLRTAFSGFFRWYDAGWHGGSRGISDETKNSQCLSTTWHLLCCQLVYHLLPRSFVGTLHFSAFFPISTALILHCTDLSIQASDRLLPTRLVSPRIQYGG